MEKVPDLVNVPAPLNAAREAEKARLISTLDLKPEGRSVPVAHSDLEISAENYEDSNHSIQNLLEDNEVISVFNSPEKRF